MPELIPFVPCPPFCLSSSPHPTLIPSFSPHTFTSPGMRQRASHNRHPAHNRRSSHVSLHSLPPFITNQLSQINYPLHNICPYPCSPHTHFASPEMQQQVTPLSISFPPLSTHLPLPSKHPPPSSSHPSCSFPHFYQPWDAAAGIVIAEEAGARISTGSGTAYSPFDK